MDDLISRQAAIDALKNMYESADKWGYIAADEIIKIRAESCMASLIEMRFRIEKLPSVQPERKKGRWIDHGQYADFFPHKEFRCSECDQPYLEIEMFYNFCPNCGADMRGEKDGN